MGTDRFLKLARGIAFAAAAALVAAASAGAQGVVSAGQTVSGRLDASDYLRDNDNTWYDDWFFDGRAGDVLTVTLAPNGFRPWLIIGKIASGNFVPEQYGGANSGNNAQLSYTVPSDGRVVVRVNVMGAGNGGPYSLRVDRTSAGGSGGGSATGAAGYIALNQIVSGQLESSDPTMGDGTHYDMWRFIGLAGQRIRITMRSGDFDAYMTIGSFATGEYGYIKGDDDSAGGNDSMIEFTLPSSGEYGIRANSMGRSVGRYTITVQAF